MTPLRAIVLGGFTVGALDGLDAIVFFGLRNQVSPTRIFQAIASGLLGRASFQGGALTVLLGVVLHLTIATSIVTIYYLGSRYLPTLVRHPFWWGPPYGIAVYLTMNLVVVPLSAAANGPRPLAVVLNGLLIHIGGVGMPAALFARAARTPPGLSPSAP